MHSPLRLYGRSGELAILDTLLVRLRNGDGGALVLTALPGVGRTALLDKAVAAHRERRTGPVLSATAAPAEQRLPYSGLHALLCSAPAPLPLPPGLAVPPTSAAPRAPSRDTRALRLNTTSSITTAMALP